MVAGIVGLGLMGGSLALDLKDLDFIEKVIGFDKNIDHKKEAKKLNLVDEIVEFDDIKKCDVVFLAIPVEGIIETLQKLKDVNENITIIDLGSTKEKIIQNVPKEIRKNFVAAHPMTGTEKFGPTAAFKGLYKDKIVVLCNTQDSADKQNKIAQKIFTK